MKGFNPMQKFFTLLVLTSLLTQTVFADEVVFTNGERLIGSVVKLVGGKLTFKSETLGELNVDLDQIKTFTTDEPVDLHLADGTILKSKTQLTESGQIHLAGTDLIKAQQIDLDQIEAINPPKPKWTGSLNIGADSSHGNSFDQSATVSIDGLLREKERRTTFDALFVISRTKDSDGEKRTTEEDFTFKAKRDFFLTKQWYTFINGGYKKDHIADLDRRVIVGFGTGYQWIEEDKIKYNTDIGLAYRHEKYDTRIDNPDPNASDPIQEITTSDDIAAQLGHHFYWQFHRRWKFINSLGYFPNLSKFSDYFLTSTAELRYQHKAQIFSSIKATLDYDATPAEDSSTTDMKYILSLGYNY
jgi:putative salt-induced outer membrane protein YdiY